MSTLVIAAHPDDEVLGCGGTLARFAADGEEVYVAILGEGVTSRYHNREDAPEEDLQALRADSQRAADLLGVKQLFTFGLPDNRFDTVPLLNVVKIIEDLVEELSPDVVYTQHGGDLNIDHEVTFRATLTATRPSQDLSVTRVYAYEVPSSTEWAFGCFSPRFSPNVFVDIADTLETKVRAMEAYEGEARPYPHPRSPDALRATARKWGSTAGLAAAEAFELVRGIAR